MSDIPASLLASLLSIGVDVCKLRHILRRPLMHDVHIQVANAGPTHFDQHLSGTRLRLG